MKGYNLQFTSKEFPWGNMDIIMLGEDGRGRRYEIIPFHAKGAYYYDIASTKSGKTKIVKCPDERNWLARLNSQGCYTRNTYGSVFVQKKDMDRVRVISRGKGAYGDAGRIGRWYDYLTTIKDRTFIFMRPSGGSHKIHRYWLYFGIDEVHKVKKEEIDIFCDQYDLDVPIIDNLVDLVEFKISSPEDIFEDAVDDAMSLNEKENGGTI